MALSLQRTGASVGAAIAFFLGNPTLNLAVLIWIAFALGWQWAALRLGLGLLLVFSAAAAAARMVGPAPVAADVASTRPDDVAEERPWAVRWVQSFVRFAVLLVPLMLVLVLALGAARVFLFPAVDAQWGNHWLVIVGLALAGAAFPIPTGAEIPLIQAMMAAGLGPGPAGALLLTLAPLSVPSLAMLAHALPLRVIGLLAGLTVVTGIVAGLIAMALL